MKLYPRHYAETLLDLCAHKTHAQIDVCIGEFLTMMRNRGKGRVVWDVLHALRTIALKKENGERITVAVPHELGKGERDILDVELRTAFGKQSAISFIYDERLLGGMRLTIGDTVYDDSSAARLAALKKQLLLTA